MVVAKNFTETEAAISKRAVGTGHFDTERKGSFFISPRNKTKHLRIYKIIILVSAAVVLGLPAHALRINTNYNEDAFNRGGFNLDDVKAAFGFAATEFETLYSDDITINLDVDWVPDSSCNCIAQSFHKLVGNSGAPRPTYDQVRNALTQDQTSDASIWRMQAIASLPATLPPALSGFDIPRAEAKAVGLVPTPNDRELDGGVIFALPASEWTLSPKIAYDPTDPRVVAPKKYDFISSAEHEISEALVDQI
jgi:hypothetical protein